MKIIYALSILPLFLAANVLDAQSSLPLHLLNKNKISMDLVSGIWGRIPLTSEWGLIYNRSINPRTEVSAKLAFSDINLFLRGIPLNDGGELQDSVGVNGIALGGSVQYFWDPSGQHGWFSGVECNYTFTHFQDKNDKDQYFDLSKLSTSLIVGYRLFLPSVNMELDIFIGVGAAFRNYDWQKFKGRNSNEPANGEVVNASWSLGWDLVLESSTAIAKPVGVRLGYRF